MTTRPGLVTADPLTGRLLEGRYRVGERIARGGTSTVYAAIDERLDRQVAVKVMNDGLSANPAFVDRFSSEARAAARLTHLNAVAVYDQGDDDGHVFLVMELVPGRTLRDLLHERGALPPAQAVSLMEPVLGALAAAHRAGLIHRDVKPENILLSDEGVVKVADFGLARAVEQGASAQTGAMLGTVAYCSPEQIRRQRTDARSDVYSAGIVLFELLTGRPPYVSDSPVEVAYQHVHGSVPPPSRLAPDVAPQLDELVLRATAADPGSRPLDAGAFLAELADVRADLALPVIRVPVRPRPPRRPVIGEADTVELRTPTDVLADGFGDTQWLDGAARPFDTVVDLGSPPTDRADRRERADPARRPGQTPAAPPRRTPAGKPVSTRRRLRRTALVLVLLLLLGAAAGVGGWWFASGRWASVPAVGLDDPTLARTALTSSGLQVAPEQQAEFSETVPKNKVIRTDPAAGSRAHRGELVHLFVSRGPERFTVPDIRGRAETDARTALAGIPVQVSEQTANDDTVPKGAAIGTDPAAGTAVRRDSAITLLVSAGPPSVAVPGVAGRAQGDATADLKNAGFSVAAQQANDDSVPAGTVISQTPGPTQSAVKFSTVTIVVSLGPRYVTLPNVHGRSAEAATKTLEQAGFTVSVHNVFGGLLNMCVGVEAAPQDKNARGQVRHGASLVIDIA